MLSKRVGRGLAAALALLWLTGIVLAQEGHTLLGKISLPSGTTPNRSVKVTITSAGVLRSTFTDSEGRYSFSNLSNKVYELTVEGDNETYETTSVRVEVFTLSAAPTDYYQNIQLKGRELQLVSHSGTATVDEGDSSIPAKARKEFQEGEKSAAENKAESAVAHYTEALSIYPSYYAARVALGDEYERLGRHDDAIGCYKKAIGIQPGRVRAVAGLGAALTRQRKYSEAIPWLRKSVEIDNQASISYLYLGLAELNTGNLTDSEQHLRKAYSIGKHAVAHIYLASLCEHRDDLAGAVSELELFIKEAPDSPQAPEIRDDIVKIRKKMAEKR